jgi:hypothetical protein
VKAALGSAQARGCHVGLSIAAGKQGRISVLSTDSVRPPHAAPAAPLQARNTFVRSAALPLAKSREQRSSRQLLMRQPLVYDVLLLRMLLPHVDDRAPPHNLCLNTSSM